MFRFNNHKNYMDLRKFHFLVLVFDILRLQIPRFVFLISESSIT